jgi:hypothetical protein
MGMDFLDEPGTGVSKGDLVSAAISGVLVPTDKAAAFEAIDETGGVRSMHNQQSA